jgi:hypothetical protein
MIAVLSYVLALLGYLRLISRFCNNLGSEDHVFAIRWEKVGKSDYTHAYDVNWKAYTQHKAKGVSMKDFFGKGFAD